MVKEKKEKAGRKKKKKLGVSKTTRKPARPKPTPKKVTPKLKRKVVSKKKESVSVLKARYPKETLQKEITLELPKVEIPQEVITPPEEKVISPPPVTKEKPKELKKEVKEEVKKEIQEPEVIVAIPPIVEELELKLPITVKDLAVRLQEKPSILIKTLMDMGVMVGINQLLEEPQVKGVCEKFGFKIKRAASEEELALRVHQEKDLPAVLQPRPPIVTLMGHVDHGKTSLLDAIRRTKVAEFEYGGITQHIGAYRVVLPHGEITFLDTPGHEAFTAMRSRGARITDIVVLVIAADDGVMPQTIEAIDHSRAAGVSIIAAINKIDKSQANIERVKKQLSELNLTPEDWGGSTITVPVSAKTGQGINDLLEMILLEAQMLELKANPKRLACGVVIEAKMSKGRGPVSTLLIQNGTLHLNENIIAGPYYGKIRAMFNDLGRSVLKAGPSFPVEVLGVSGLPAAGEQFYVIPDEKLAKELVLKRQEKEKLQQVKKVERITLEDLYNQIKEGKLKELKLIIKADVQGTLEAIKETLNKINVSEIKLNILHEGVGNINTSDAILAAVANALILGFNISIDERAKEIINQEGVDARTYNVIYELTNDIKSALEGMLEPKLKKVFLGKAEVRKVFKLSRAGTIAGCFVIKGKITRSCLVNLIRNDQVVFEGNISSLKRFKDDVREVLEGFECGIGLSGFQDLQEGDIIEAYVIEKIARKL